MSAGDSILDELSFVRAPLQSADLAELAPSVDTTFSLYVNGSTRPIQFARPFFVSELGQRQTGGSWSTLCGLLRRQGIPIFSSVVALQDVPAASVPPRLARRFVNEPLDAVELQTAEAFEIACRAPSGRSWGWTSEITTEQLGEFVEAIRQASGGDTPVGIGLPLGCHELDLRSSLKASVDFVSLVASGPTVGRADIRAVAQARRICSDCGQASLPLFVNLPISNADQAMKVLALGASAICIDSLLSNCIPKPAAGAAVGGGIGSGMLSGITAGPRKAVGLPQVEQALEQLNQTLHDTLRSVGAKRLQQCNVACLRDLPNRESLLTAD
jgi:hypothetical protein